MSSSLALIILSTIWFVTSLCPFTSRCPKDENWFLMPRRLNKTPWRLGYQTTSRYLIWSSLESQTCKLYSSTRNSGFLLQWWLLVPLLRPTLWSNQYQLVGIIPVIYLGAVGRRCRFLIAQMAMGMLSSSVSLLEVAGRSQTFGTCHTS